MTVEEILQYYSDLLIIQYNDQPRAKAHIEALVNTLISNNVIIDINDGFDLSTAVGVQLDVLGKYIGTDRFYDGTIFDKTYFGFSDQFSFEPPLVTGFSDPSDFLTKVGEFLSADDVLSQSNKLNDDDYRIILAFKIIQNNIDHSTGSIDTALHDFFGTTLYATDNYNMTMTFFIPEEQSALILAAFSKGVLPIPMTIGINILPNITYFACADGEVPTAFADDVTGFSDPSDFLTKDGSFVGAEDLIT